MELRHWFRKVPVGAADLVDPLTGDSKHQRDLVNAD